MSLFGTVHRDDVFIAGGQPSITYVQRQELHIERELARAIATPNHVVSLAGPTKTGKTVLCRRVLGKREYIWIDGGQVTSNDDFWLRVCAELNLPSSTERTTESETTVEGGVTIAVVVTAGGSRLERQSNTAHHELHTMADAINYLIKQRIILVIDDFHYLSEETRAALMRNVKGPVFNGLKVILLSVTHRAFDAIRAESELTGRFMAINLPTWSEVDLGQIAILGFEALKVHYEKHLVDRLAAEAQASPFLMQRFCWEICFDNNIEKSPLLGHLSIRQDYNFEELFVRIARDAGLPIYQRLVAGPQSRKVRTKRPLRRGGDADIYEATLLALAETGPKQEVSYEELRESMNGILSSMMPQKHEITSALKHLATIAMKTGSDAAIDWDENNRRINVADPYLRFYLRWQIRRNVDTEGQEPLV